MSEEEQWNFIKIMKVREFKCLMTCSAISTDGREEAAKVLDISIHNAEQ